MIIKFLLNVVSQEHMLLIEFAIKSKEENGGWEYLPSAFPSTQSPVLLTP